MLSTVLRYFHIQHLIKYRLCENIQSQHQGSKIPDIQKNYVSGTII